MSNESLETGLHPLEHLVAEAISSSPSTPDWMVRVARAGIIVACVGGLLGGISTVHELWKAWTVHADIQVVGGSNLTVTWNRERSDFVFVRGFSIENAGDAIGLIDSAPQAWLESASMGVRRDLGEIQVDNRHDAVIFPLSIKASDSQDLVFTMAAKAKTAGNASALKAGDYKLAIALNIPASPKPDLYCFQLNAERIDELNASGSTRWVASDPCGN